MGQGIGSQSGKHILSAGRVYEHEFNIMFGYK